VKADALTPAAIALLSHVRLEGVVYTWPFIPAGQRRRAQALATLGLLTTAPPTARGAAITGARITDAGRAALAAAGAL
jgi:hypothetical protein